MDLETNSEIEIHYDRWSNMEARARGEQVATSQSVQANQAPTPPAPPADEQPTVEAEPISLSDEPETPAPAPPASQEGPFDPADGNESVDLQVEPLPAEEPAPAQPQATETPAAEPTPADQTPAGGDEGDLNTPIRLL